MKEYSRIVTAEELREAELDGLSFTDADLSARVNEDLTFTGCIFTDCGFTPHEIPPYRGALHFNDCFFTHVSFAGNKLIDASFTNCKFIDFNAINLTMISGTLKNCEFYGRTNFESAAITNSSLVRITFLGESANFAHTTFTRTILNRVKASPVNPFNFKGSKLDSVKILNCDFRYADLQDASFCVDCIKGSDFSHSNLRGCNISVNDIENTSFTGADINGSEVYSTSNLPSWLEDAVGEITISNKTYTLPLQTEG